MIRSSKEKGWRLIHEASRILNRDLKLAFEQSDTSLTIRRAQEVVELSIKGALQILGVDYPKSHDVGKLLSQVAKEKQCPLEEKILQRFARVSESLAEMRGPSFYGEEDYSIDQARDAFEEARFVLETIEKHFKGSVAQG